MNPEKKAIYPNFKCQYCGNDGAVHRAGARFANLMIFGGWYCNKECVLSAMKQSFICTTTKMDFHCGSKCNCVNPTFSVTINGQ